MIPAGPVALVLGGWTNICVTYGTGSAWLAAAAGPLAFVGVYTLWTIAFPKVGAKEGERGD
jgi:hypothetical protein